MSLHVLYLPGISCSRRLISCMNRLDNNITWPTDRIYRLLVAFVCYVLMNCMFKFHGVHRLTHGINPLTNPPGSASLISRVMPLFNKLVLITIRSMVLINRLLMPLINRS